MESTHRQSQTKKPVIIILILSFVILASILWVIYLKRQPENIIPWTRHLPVVNTALNALTAILLMGGYWAIKSGKRDMHVKFMLSAMTASFLFLIGYILYHYGHGETAFMGQGWIRPLYFFILISHIILSAVQLPLILMTAFFALTKRFSAHKRIAKWALPIWLYVSTTGVLIFVLLKSVSSS